MVIFCEKPALIEGNNTLHILLGTNDLVRLKVQTSIVENFKVLFCSDNCQEVFENDRFGRFSHNFSDRSGTVIFSEYPANVRCSYEFETGCDSETQDVRISVSPFRSRGGDASCSKDYFEFSGPNGIKDLGDFGPMQAWLSIASLHF